MSGTGATVRNWRHSGRRAKRAPLIHRLRSNSPSSAGPPSGQQDQAEKRAKPTPNIACEEDSAIEHHEKEEAMQTPGHPFRLLAMARQSAPGPDDVAQPNESKSIVEIEAAAPIPPEPLRRLPRCMLISLRMAPAVVIVEGVSHVSKKGRTTEGVQPTGFGAKTGSAPERLHRLGGGIERQRQPNGSAG